LIYSIKWNDRNGTMKKQYSGGANGNRSLERGLEILRAFRPGVDTLGNGELAERTGLPRSTVSRLTRTLVTGGMLDEVLLERSYRLAAATISLGHAVRVGSPVLKILGPLMRAESARCKLNIGLATADRTMMVYLESVQYHRSATLRSVVAGQQIPMELTSLGRAYLSGLSKSERNKLIGQFKRRSASATKALRSEILKSIHSVEQEGYCAVSWQPGVLAVATPIILGDLPAYAMNMSVQDVEPSGSLATEIGKNLVAFSAKCTRAFLCYRNDVTGSEEALV
jgi:DNA-binding IclR family transcriptional regulator